MPLPQTLGTRPIEHPARSRNEVLYDVPATPISGDRQLVTMKLQEEEVPAEPAKVWVLRRKLALVAESAFAVRTRHACAAANDTAKSSSHPLRPTSRRL